MSATKTIPSPLPSRRSPPRLSEGQKEDAGVLAGVSAFMEREFEGGDDCPEASDNDVDLLDYFRAVHKAETVRLLPCVKLWMGGKGSECRCGWAWAASQLSTRRT